MKFKDLQINQRFRFVCNHKHNLKIYTKVEIGLASRYLYEYVIFPDTEVELVKEDEKEDYEAIEKGSYYSYLIHKEGAKNPNEND